MTDRTPLRPILRRQRQDVNLLYTTLADSIENAVARQTRLRPPDTPITEQDRAAIMREVRQGLSVIHGPQRGAQSALESITVRDTQVARVMSLESTVRRWKDAMGRTLAERVEQEARQP